MGKLTRKLKEQDYYDFEQDWSKFLKNIGKNGMLKDGIMYLSGFNR